MKKQLFILSGILIIIGFLMVILLTRKNNDGISGSGMIEVTEVNIASKITGHIEKLSVEEGQAVNQNDTLLVIEHKELLSQKQKVESMLKTAQLSLSALKLKEYDLKNDLDRIRNLYAVGDVSKKELESYELQYKILQTNIKKARANIDVVSAELSLINNQLSNAFITSPITGIVLARNFEVGELVTPGKNILRIGNLDTAWLKIFIPETEIGKIRLGARALVYVDAYPKETFTGQVNWISDEAEFIPKNVQTREERADLVFAIKVTIPNPAQKLLPGMPADARIIENAHR